MVKMHVHIMRRYLTRSHPITKKSIYKAGNPEEIDIDKAMYVRVGYGTNVGTVLIYFDTKEIANSASSIPISDTLIETKSKNSSSKFILKIKSDDVRLEQFAEKLSVLYFTSMDKSISFGYQPEACF